MIIAKILFYSHRIASIPAPESTTSNAHDAVLLISIDSLHRCE